MDFDFQRDTEREALALSGDTVEPLIVTPSEVSIPLMSPQTSQEQEAEINLETSLVVIGAPYRGKS